MSKGSASSLTFASPEAKRAKCRPPCGIGERSKGGAQWVFGQRWGHVLSRDPMPGTYFAYTLDTPDTNG